MAGFLWEGVAAVKLEGIIILGKKGDGRAGSKADPKQERVLPLILTLGRKWIVRGLTRSSMVVQAVDSYLWVGPGGTAVCLVTRRF